MVKIKKNELIELINKKIETKKTETKKTETKKKETKKKETKKKETKKNDEKLSIKITPPKMGDKGFDPDFSKKTKIEQLEIALNNSKITGEPQKKGIL